MQMFMFTIWCVCSTFRFFLCDNIIVNIHFYSSIISHNCREVSAPYHASNARLYSVYIFLIVPAVPHNGLFQKISTTPLWTTLNWVPKTFRISKNDSSSFCRIPNLSDSKSLGIPEFCNILNGFRGIPVKIHKILGKFMDLKSC